MNKNITIKEFKYKNPDDGFALNSLCYHKEQFARVIKLEDNIATIEKKTPLGKEDLYFFTPSDESDVYEPSRIYPHEYELVLEPHPEYRVYKK